jgi:hypothetical protein
VRRPLFLIIAVLAVCGLGAPAMTRASSLTPHLVTLQFSRIRGSRLVGTGRGLIVFGRSYRAGAGRFVNGVSGRQSYFRLADCREPDTATLDWAVFTCGSGASAGFALERTNTGRYRPFTPGPGLLDANCVPGVCARVAAVGTDWIAVTSDCEAAGCAPTYRFQNLSTGQVVADPANAATTLSLDARGLSVSACQPLRVPGPFVAGWGWLSRAGMYEIASGAAGSYLERCGSRLHEFLTRGPTTTGCPSPFCPPPTNGRAVIWEAAPGVLRGLSLPGRRPFEIALPEQVDPGADTARSARADPYRLILTDKTLYLLNQYGALWAAPARDIGSATP